jgi:hypothetical protein
MEPKTLLLTTSSTRPRLRGLSVHDYAADPDGVEPALRQAQGRLIWLEPASEIYYWQAAALARLAEHVEAGGGLLVTGGIGEGFLFRTFLGEMLPARAVFQEDARPQHHVRDVKRFADSVWFTSGEVVVEDAAHPLLEGVGLKAGMRLLRGYVAESKPGARVLVRFATYESVGATFDLEPLDMPCLATLRRRAEVLGALEAKPETALLDELARRVSKADVSTAKGRKAFLGVVPELEELARDAGAALEAAEAGLFREAFEAYKAFYAALARAEVEGAAPKAELARLRHEGELAKVHFNARAYLQAARTYRALTKAIGSR